MSDKNTIRCAKLYPIFLRVRSLAVQVAILPIATTDALIESAGRIGYIGSIASILGMFLTVAVYFVVAMTFWPVGFLISTRYGLAPTESSSCVDVATCLLAYGVCQALLLFAAGSLARVLW